MNKLLTTTALLVCLSVGRLFAIDFDWAPAELVGSQEAACRVTVRGARGSGTFFEYNDTKAYILTNYHVIEGNNTATLDFWTNHVQQSIQGKVIWKAYNINIPYDFAIIEVDAVDLKNRINPPYIPLKPEGVDLPSERFIISAGCPKGQHVQAWKGKVNGKQGATTLFTAHPSHGQSGSAICGVIDGKLAITDVCTWLMGDENSDASKGGAIPIDNLYRALESSHFEPTSEPTSSPTEPAVPLDAVEISEKVPYVIEFTQDNCPPCGAAKKDVEALQKDDFVVFVQNITNSPEARDLATKYHIDQTPTFVVCDQNGTEVSRYVGAGTARKVANDLKALIKVQREQDGEEPQAEEPKEEEPECDEDSCDWVDKIVGITDLNKKFKFADDLEELQEEPKAEVAPPKKADTSFRNRAPVYEYIDAAFLDANRNRWFRHGEQEEAKPEKPTAPQIDEEKLGNRIGGRITNGISGSLESAIDKAAGTIEKKLDEKISKRIDDMKKEAYKKYVALRFRFAVLTFIFVVIAVLTAESIKACFVWTFKKIRALWNAVVMRAAQNIQFAAGKVAEKAESVVAETTSKKNE